MRATKTLVISLLVAFGLLATTQVANAAPKKQTVTFSVTGDCQDEQEMIEMVEGESTDNCKIVVQISPTTPARSAILDQYNDDDEEWDQVSTAKSKSGKITFSIDATDEDDAWLDGDFTFRVTVKRLGTRKAFVSDEYTFTFITADSVAEDEEGTGEGSVKQGSKSTGNTKLDGILDSIDNKDTKYDDKCTKKFGADCKLMFTPTGPDWTKLTPVKWQTMCEQLLNQNTANCKLMYGPGSTGDTKLDSVFGNIDNKDTKYDDKCAETFGADCKSMFTPTGPDWTKLTPAKWQTMCEQLLKQTTANCKLMYGRSAPPPGSSGNTGGSGGQPPSGGSGGQPPSGGSGGQPPSGGGGITEDTIKKACTTVGIADCTAIVKLMMDAMAAGKMPDPQAMGRLLGNKMDAFFRAMSPSGSGG